MHIKKIKFCSKLYPVPDQYPFSLPLLKSMNTIEFTTPATFFLGENGTGKSTLLEAIARKAGIHIWEGMYRTRYKVNKYEKTLCNYLDVEWVDKPVPGSFFAAEIFKNFSQLLDEWAANDAGVLSYFGNASLMTQSHGQGHMAYFKSRYGIKGVYFLDEPENALSPKMQIELLNLLAKIIRGGHAQFIIATHSPILLSLQNATILSFDSPQLKRINYKECDHYLTYKRFLNDDERSM